jgi:hypothetical protein
VTIVKVAGICTSNIKAKELDIPLAGGAGVVGGGAVPTAGAAAAAAAESIRILSLRQLQETKPLTDGYLPF